MGSPSIPQWHGIVNVTHWTFVCLVVNNVVVFYLAHPSMFLWLRPVSKEVQDKAACLLHVILSHVRLSLVLWWHHQWPKTATPLKHQHACVPQKCCTSLFDVHQPPINWEKHFWPCPYLRQSLKCSSLLNHSADDAEVSRTFILLLSSLTPFFCFLAVGLRPDSTEIRGDSCYRYAGLITCQLIADIWAGQRGSLTFFPF